MAITDKLAAIGDAIREKTGGTDELTLDQMVTEIGNISGGSTIDFTTIEDAWINKTTLPVKTYTNTRVTKIKYGAFAYINSLTSVNLPKVTTINNSAFFACSNLKSINAPNVTELGESVFSATSLSEVNFPNVRYVGSSCFYGTLQKFTAVDFPAALVVSDSAFENNGNLVTVNLPEIVTLSSNVFRGCSSLKTVNAPKVTALYDAFSGCTTLKTIDFPELKTIGGYRKHFDGCSALTAFIIRNTDKVLSLTVSNTFQNTPIASGTGYIYVPDELVEDYKVATNWVTYANQIKPLSEYVEVTE